MKVRILGDWTLRIGGTVHTKNSKPFDLPEDQARKYERRLMIEVIPEKVKPHADKPEH